MYKNKRCNIEYKWNQLEDDISERRVCIAAPLMKKLLSMLRGARFIFMSNTFFTKMDKRISETLTVVMNYVLAVVKIIENAEYKSWCSLRVRAFFHKTVRVCHVYCNFKIGFTCWITVIFGTLKDGSLLINTLASNICFSYRNMFQNGVDALPKIVDAFLSKSSKFHLVRIIR